MARVSPRTIEEIPLATGVSTLVVKRRLSEVRSISAPHSRFGLPQREVLEIQEREQEWRDFWTLWRFLENPDLRPAVLDLRGCRVRLQKVVGM